MTQLLVTFSVVNNFSDALGRTQPVMRASSAEGLTPLTTTGAAQVVQRTGVDWTAPANGYISVFSGVATWVRVSSAGSDAAAGVDWDFALGERRDFEVLSGEKISVINA